MPNLERRRWRDGRRLNAKREGRQRTDQADELASLATSDDDGRQAWISHRQE